LGKNSYSLASTMQYTYLEYLKWKLGEEQRKRSYRSERKVRSEGRKVRE
jgi:hypothetical protein